MVFAPKGGGKNFPAERGSFNEKDHEILISALNKNFGINCSIHSHKSGSRIYINKADLSKIKPLLIPYIIPSMMYK